MKKPPPADPTREIMSDPEFYAEIIRNRRAFDRGRGRAYDLDDVFGEKASASRAKPKRAVASKARRG